MIDEQGQVSLNHSSVITNVYSSNDKMAQVDIVPQSAGDLIQDSTAGKYEEIYDKRVVRFSNITGTVELIASAQYYLKDQLDTAL